MIYIDSGKENNDIIPKFELDEYVRMSQCKKHFINVTLQSGLKKCFWLKK